MRKLHSLLVIIALLPMALALGGTASAAPPNDSAIGSGKVAVLGGTAASFSLSAHSGPQGEDAKGNLNFRDISFNVPGSAEKARQP